VRAGLSLNAAHLEAADELAALLDVTPECRWGMSPFAGSTTDSAWHSPSLRGFLRTGQDHTPLQAAFRLAYELPAVTHVAVGTDDPAHLDELVVAIELPVAPGAIGHYRQLIGAEATRASP
jgi:hypothetical protein